MTLQSGLKSPMSVKNLKWSCFVVTVPVRFYVCNFVCLQKQQLDRASSVESSPPVSVTASPKRLIVKKTRGVSRKVSIQKSSHYSMVSCCLRNKGALFYNSLDVMSFFLYDKLAPSNNSCDVIVICFV